MQNNGMLTTSVDLKGNTTEMGSHCIGYETNDAWLEKSISRVLGIKFVPEKMCAGVSIQFECTKWQNGTGHSFGIRGAIIQGSTLEDLNSAAKDLVRTTKGSLLGTVPENSKDSDDFTFTGNIESDFILYPDENYILVLFSELDTGYDVVIHYYKNSHDYSISEYDGGSAHICTSVDSNGKGTWTKAIPYICTSVDSNGKGTWIKAIPYICTSIDSNGKGTWKICY